MDDDESCVNNRCAGDSKCINLPGDNYACLCPDGLTGKFCDAAINYCLPLNPCYNGGTCISNSSNYTCVCELGNLALFAISNFFFFFCLCEVIEYSNAKIYILNILFFFL